MEGSTQDPRPRSNLRPSGPLRWALPLILLAVGGGYGLYRWLSPGAPAPTLEQPPAPRPDAGDAGGAPTTAVAAAPEEPPATAAEAPGLLERASRHPLVAKGLALPALLRRWAVVTENVAQGDSPRKELAFLAPAGRFAAMPRGDVLVVAPESWARYDEVAAAARSLDARAAASAYRRLHGVLDQAFQALGYRPGAIDAATARALRRIADAPLVREDTPVVRAEGGFVWAEAELEQLPEVEKHLLRMGPRNQAALQAKARELLAALGLDPSQR